ncbi:MAG TPA: ABC transporter ATP-binding protein [Mesorhizobium sp.]|jgi:glycerol transport system ATP-binding protein
MAEINLMGVGHSYGGDAYALEKADLRLEDGKTYALLGPSGCGKTTMLNIISGLIYPSDGRVVLGGKDVTRVKTAARNIAQVFQFPVVYQSKTVFENLAFPLRCRNWESARIRARVNEVAELLGLTSRLHMSSRRLTADEKQLISLGRGLVRDDVAALLMDEPLTVIDPQMKFELRRKIKQANDQTRHTVIYVTHDQNEAMTFADEIVVMKAGRVIQRGTPQELFEKPYDTYVGNFIGSPGMNFIGVERHGDRLMLGEIEVLAGARVSALPASGKFTIGIRPEHLAFEASSGCSIPAWLVSVQDHGKIRVLELALATSHIKMKIARDVSFPGTDIRVFFSPDRIRLYADGIFVN